MLRDKRHLGRALRRSRIRGWSVLSLCCVATRQNLKKVSLISAYWENITNRAICTVDNAAPSGSAPSSDASSPVRHLASSAPPKYVPGCEQGRTARSYGLLG
ncbi:hypothetical protein FOXG_20739 [Fusarium oxysporum f. sp. lycopersici 4287]|uniref:Uncharacterized protein n=1 Tax=Fusarium oxysporum f. sp. lycopersici (strain 4287 / CBS 123668 / FGSC 9935 / NRRL 34936) TaxID=426428 RepID=A0A0J9VQ87_FUSO4|nr:hypothetical protein FOXG_20739 [Fusarium oxysporum f. sp. lycopersici 4287]XP_018251042.1 hypothetical protein FOXG_20739 [Fusarium oxysporum f. sp. lycopersici 4287]XP_018251043.1 hypothetical protein FOXG_20739 [Fusarium oxysporum f. sp. lycopersici 4287]XP_018251044.1 hypothetical protein FOXG_20739 [Fusarium oxysporum f. sp. lycopersici 4287]KNB12996.1 hypothetical protein FOXG_20739 [Fusarium oxysporum f. sp. lycopersici 4287]KNB12997.1 hypothetical protein FOXG_20739 [Fusarium oxyspo